MGGQRELMELMDPVVHLDPQAFQGTRGLEWPLRQAGAPRAGVAPLQWSAVPSFGGLWRALVGWDWPGVVIHPFPSS